ncbi:hypothetical protein [Bernardetia sp. MNP-M8]|uniref:hypothetical protein n=1 Tax=Bernardetia sp. MNP-M8 TaxID=3127470 RepID=UPI0030CD0BED
MPSPPSYNLEEQKDISLFVKRFYINKKEQIIKKQERIELTDTILTYSEYALNTSSLSMYYRKNNDIGSEHIELINGYPIGNYEVAYGKQIVRIVPYQNKQLEGFLEVYTTNDSLLYKSIFLKGEGYWKDYYYKQGTIKEEGLIRNNYKYETWKYYNKTGEVDSIKVYSLQDAVDIRYPYCLFNKNEPCF